MFFTLLSKSREKQKKIIIIKNLDDDDDDYDDELGKYSPIAPSDRFDHIGKT